MSGSTQIAIMTAVLALPATAVPAQIYPLTNGPNGAQSNTIDSARGWDGINSVAPERELLYHPERGSGVMPMTGAEPAARGEDAPSLHPARRRRRHALLR